MKHFAFLFILVAFSLFYVVRPTYAISYELLPPSGTLTRGQTITFTIDIDTEGAQLTDTSVGMTYDTQYLQYLSTTPGDTFSTIQASPIQDGKLVISGSSPQGFTGTGTFANVNFKLIATAPGSTELCVLYDVSPTPTTAQPTTQPTPTFAPGQPTPTPTPITVLPSAPPPASPTAIPRAGTTSNAAPILGLFSIAIGGLFAMNGNLKILTHLKRIYKTRKKI